MMTLMDQVNDLRHAIDRLSDVLETQNEKVTSIVRVIHDNATWLHDYVAALDDAATFQWAIRYGISDIKHWLVPIRGYLDLLHMGVFEEPTPPQKHCIDQALQHVDQLSTLFHTCFTQAEDMYKSDALASPLRVLTDVALAPVWPILRFHFSRSHFHISYTPSQAPIVYHRIHTTSLLISFIDALGNSFIVRNMLSPDQIINPIFHMDAHPTRDAYRILLRTHPLMMTPDLWRRLHNGDAVEYLYELGGSIDPLTWDEGQGQGIIMRLPYAHDQGGI